MKNEFSIQKPNEGEKKKRQQSKSVYGLVK